MSKKQTRKMSTIVDHKLNGHQMLSLLSKLSSDQIRKTLEVLKGAIKESNFNLPIIQSDEGLTQSETEAILEHVEKKIQEEQPEIDLDNLEDKKIGQVLMI